MYLKLIEIKTDFKIVFAKITRPPLLLLLANAIRETRPNLYYLYVPITFSYQFIEMAIRGQ